MKRVPALLLLAGILCAWSASASSVEPRCVVGHTLAEDSAARVYSSGGSVYGCAFSGGTTWKLGSATICNVTPCAEHFALARTVVAYGLERFGIDAGSATVVVRRLGNGTIVHQDSATSRGVVEGYGTAASLVVKTDGSDAWIGVEDSIIGHGRVVEVHRHDKRGSALLDSTDSIRPTSLKLHGAHLSWRDGGVTRHSTLH